MPSKTLDRIDISTAVAKRMHVKLERVAITLYHISKEIAEQVTNGNEVKIKFLGHFKRIHRKARTFQSPYTDQPITTPECYVMRFKMDKKLRKVMIPIDGPIDGPIGETK
jgi:nucleoid DNA-binding protein